MENSSHLNPKQLAVAETLDGKNNLVGIGSTVGLASGGQNKPLY